MTSAKCWWPTVRAGPEILGARSELKDGALSTIIIVIIRRNKYIGIMMISL